MLLAERDAERLGLADDQRRDEGAGDRAQPADDDDDQREQQHVVADAGRDLLDRPADDAGEGGERGPREQHRQRHEVDVVAERRDHRAVFDGGAQDRAELRALEDEVRRDRDHDADDDHCEPVGRVVVPEDHLALKQEPGGVIVWKSRPQMIVTRSATMKKRPSVSST